MAGKTPPNPPDSRKLEYKFGMRANKLTKRGDSWELGSAGRKEKIQNKIFNAFL